MKMNIKRKIYNAAGVIGKIIEDRQLGTSQDSTKAGETAIYDNPQLSALCRKAAADGAVLLKNNDNILPLTGEDTVSVFSRLQYDWMYMGYGSGGDVNAPYLVDFIQGLKNAGIKYNETLAQKYISYCRKNPAEEGVWGRWPANQLEMKITDADICQAAEISNKAIVIIGRSAGEDRDLELKDGSYYLAKEETRLLDSVTSAFDKVILILNCSNIIDFSALASYGDKISSILYAWQCGMESGNALADNLCGEYPPCGKLPDTVAESYQCYPSAGSFGAKDFVNYTEDIYVGYRYFETFAKNRVLYPFGFGLTFTSFSFEKVSFRKLKKSVKIKYTIKNTGNFKGRETAQLYFEAPCGNIGNPSRVLCAYAKTGMLESGETESGEFSVALNSLACYDDVTTHSYLLPAGTYNFYLGSDVRSAFACGSFTLEEEIITQKLSQCAAPQYEFLRMVNKNGAVSYEIAPMSKVNLKKVIEENMPQIPSVSYAKKCTLGDVKEGKSTLKEFVMTLSPDELEALSRGDFTMNSPLGVSGNAGVYCGVLESLRKKGVPPVTFTDGPAGIRLNTSAALLPAEVALAATFDTGLIEELYKSVASEMKSLGSQVLACPGMNIHRNPLCGRNFEYFSEDPYLTGTMGAATVKGLQSKGVSACPKHFACNNQERNRTHNDSRLSERALREIYLKGFEICVKESAPLCIMTSYNKINGVWGHYHYELVNRILRREWGYKGCVITDWWMRSAKSPEFPIIRDQAYRVRAGVNVFMPGGSRTGKRVPDGTLLESLGRNEGITLAELRENAEYVLTFALNFID